MSAAGTYRTSVFALHMSAIGGKADMAGRGCLLLRSLLGVKRTCHFAPHMSACDPKRTSSPDPDPRCMLIVSASWDGITRGGRNGSPQFFGHAWPDGVASRVCLRTR